VVATCDGREEAGVYLSGERVGMTVHQPPGIAFPTEDQGDAQRPILARKLPDASVLSFNGDQDC
jgi:hypothetical protein